MRKPFILFAIAILTFSIYGLFKVKYQVQDLKKELVEVNRQVAVEKEEIHVLRAEWVYLNKPERIKTLADKHLSLKYTQVSQLTDKKGLNTSVIANKDGDIRVKPTLKPILSSMRRYR